MCKQDAHQFLEDATQNITLRDKCQAANNPSEFISLATGLGYHFTAQDLKNVIQESSEAVILRRKTGIWPWLRQVNWV